MLRSIALILASMYPLCAQGDTFTFILPGFAQGQSFGKDPDALCRPTSDPEDNAYYSRWERVPCRGDEPPGRTIPWASIDVQCDSQFIRVSVPPMLVRWRKQGNDPQPVFRFQWRGETESVLFPVMSTLLQAGERLNSIEMLNPVDVRFGEAEFVRGGGIMNMETSGAVRWPKAYGTGAVPWNPRDEVEWPSFTIPRDQLWGFLASRQRASDQYDRAASAGGSAKMEAPRMVMVIHVVRDPLSTLEDELFPANDDGERSQSTSPCHHGGWQCERYFQTGQAIPMPYMYGRQTWKGVEMGGSITVPADQRNELNRLQAYFNACEGTSSPVSSREWPANVHAAREAVRELVVEPWWWELREMTLDEFAAQ